MKIEIEYFSSKQKVIINSNIISQTQTKSWQPLFKHEKYLYWNVKSAGMPVKNIKDIPSETSKGR